MMMGPQGQGSGGMGQMVAQLLRQRGGATRGSPFQMGAAQPGQAKSGVPTGGMMPSMPGMAMQRPRSMPMQMPGQRFGGMRF
jgi:hypothetical protein